MNKPVYVWIVSKDGKHTLTENGVLPSIVSDYKANPVRFVPEALAKVTTMTGSAASLYKIAFVGVDCNGCIHMLASCLRQNKKHTTELRELCSEQMFETVTALLS